MNSEMFNLKQNVDECFKKNSGKATISFLLMLFANSLVLILLSLFLMQGNVLSYLFYPLAILSVVCSFILQYGFMVLLLRIYSKEPNVLGHLFIGFHSFKRSSKAALIYTGIYFVCIFVSVLLYILYKHFFTPEVLPVVAAEVEEELFKMPGVDTWIAVLVMVLLCFIVLFRFVFVWLIMYKNPNCSAFSAFKTSNAMLKGKKKELFVFLIQCGGIPLLIAFICFALVMVSTFIDINASFIRVASFMYTVSYVFSVIRLVFGVVAFYLNLTQDTSSNSDSPEMIEQVIYLPPSDTNE